MSKTCPARNSQFKMNVASENETHLVFDIETNGLYDAATKTFCIVAYDIGRKQTFAYGPDSIAAALDHLGQADVLIGHNIIFYDLPVLKKLFEFQFNGQVIDTLVCTRLIWPKEKLFELDSDVYEDKVPSNLKGGASLKAWGYRLSNHKIEFKDFSEYSDDMLDYCKQDVNVTVKLFELIKNQNYSQASLQLEHEFAHAINRQIRSGIPFDIDQCIDLVDVLRGKQKALEEELKKLFPPIEHKEWFVPKVNSKARGYIKGVPFEKVRVESFNPGSRQQIVERLKAKYNWTPKKKTQKGNPILNDEVLEQLPFPEAKLLAEYMLIQKRLGQIADGSNAWLKLVNNSDGRMHGDVITNGCITGRCAHRNPNTGQVPAGYSPYGKECRSLFHAPEGWDLIGIDAKALELRCLAGYLAIWDGGEYGELVTDPNGDIHTYNQKQFGVATRDISKRLLYGMLYGCGYLKAGTIIDPNCKDQNKLKDLGSAAINGFMQGVPALKKLKDQIEETIEDRSYLIGLDRRILYCRSAFKGLNVLLQSAGAILMKQVVINVHKNMKKIGLVYGKDWEQMLMVHDEIQIACAPEHTEVVREQALKAFPQAQEFFGFRCLIEGDSRVGSNWFETH